MSIKHIRNTSVSDLAFYLVDGIYYDEWPDGNVEDDFMLDP